MNPFGARRILTPPPSPLPKEGEVLTCEYYDAAAILSSRRASNRSTEICGETLTSGKAHCYGLWQKSKLTDQFVVQKKGCWINDAQCGAEPKCYPIHSNRNAQSHVFCCCHGNECNAADGLVQNHYSESPIHHVIGPNIITHGNLTFVPDYSTHNSGFVSSPPGGQSQRSNDNFFATLLSSAMATPSSRSLLIAAMTAVPLCVIVLILFVIFFAYNYRTSRVRGNGFKHGSSKNGSYQHTHGDRTLAETPSLDAHESLIYDIKPGGLENRNYFSPAFNKVYDNTTTLGQTSRPASGIGAFNSYGDWDHLIKHTHPSPINDCSGKLNSPPTLRYYASGGRRSFISFLSSALRFTPKRHDRDVKGNPKRPALSSKSLLSPKASARDPSARFRLMRLISSSPISKVYLGDYRSTVTNQRNYPSLDLSFANGASNEPKKLAIKIYPLEQRECWDRELEVYHYLSPNQGASILPAKKNNRPKSDIHPNILGLVYAQAYTKTIDGDCHNHQVSNDNLTHGKLSTSPDLLVVITPPTTLRIGECMPPQPTPAITTDYWIVTEFQEKGSLLDYLRLNTIDWDLLISMALDISAALAYLHSNYAASQSSTNLTRDGSYKPAIAHKDLKTKNIFLSNDLRVKVGDFGAAVVLSSISKIKQSQGQRGTLRYMAPEILEGAITFSQDCFLKIDVYAFALILWELMTRCHDINTNIAQYKMPYEDELSTNPSLEEMQDIICTQNVRPRIPDEWTRNMLSAELVSTIRDCWERDPEARISAITIHERIKEIACKTAP